VAPYLKEGALNIVLEAFEPPPQPVSVVYPQARLLPARTKAFVDWIRRELADLRL
jgi:DNA-binding transcriptional LysR family regulator